MIVATLAFYLFAILTVASAFMVIASKNPVHSVLFLILAFFNSAALFLLLGAEFIAMILVVVYVGAVAVLFLFVVMMLDVDFAELKAEMAQYMPLALLIGLVILMQFVMAYGTWETAHGASDLLAQPTPADQHNTEALGLIIYDQYFLLFQLSGLILLVAMIGAITLTLRHKPHIKRQNISDQVNRSAAKAMEVKSVQTGQGVSPEELL